VFKFNKMTICTLLAVLNLSLVFSQSQAAAGLFDRLSSKRKGAVQGNKSSDGQTSGPVSPATYSAGKVSLVSYADDGRQESSVPVDSSLSIPVGTSESVPEYPVTSTSIEMVDNSTHCINCGQDDHCQSCVRHCRKNCKQTWYPRTAPYCQPGWGWNQPCWRRTADNYNCPRPQQMTPPPQRRVNIPEALPEESPANPPASEDVPETPSDESRSEAPFLPRQSAVRR